VNYTRELVEAAREQAAFHAGNLAQPSRYKILEDWLEQDSQIAALHGQLAEAERERDRAIACVACSGLDGSGDHVVDELADDLLIERDGLNRRVAALERTLRKLVAKLDAICADPSYQGLLDLAATLGLPYKGPNFADELSEAKRALSAPATPEEPTK